MISTGILLCTYLALLILVTLPGVHTFQIRDSCGMNLNAY